MLKVNKSMFPIRKYAYFFDYVSQGTPKEEYTTSVSADRRNIYAEDPNYSAPASTGLLDEPESALRPWNPDGAPGTMYYGYMLENTAEDQIDMGAFTDVEIYATISEPATGFGTTYYSFKGKVFTHEQAISWINSPNESQFPPQMDGLEEAIAADKASGSRVFNFDVPAPGGLPTAYVQAQGITFHYQGLNKYLIPLKHFGTIAEAAEGDYGYYGVVRNNLYRVTINSITGPGTEVSGEAYISADVFINPWYVRDNSNDLD